MNEELLDLAHLIVMIGATIVLCMLLKVASRRVRVPALVGYLGLGFLLGVAGEAWGFLSEDGRYAFGFLAELGIAVLLFRVGLESNLHGLLQQLDRAVPLWLGNVLISGLLGYLTAYYVLGFTEIPSLVVATALTATSVGITAGIWQEANALHTPIGDLLIDTAELDDISGVLFMGLLFTVLIALRQGDQNSVAQVVLQTSLIFFLKLAGFAAFCLVFARYGEAIVTGWLLKGQKVTDRTLAVAGMGLIIAGIAGVIGFSVAIGAFCAGLIFSRDPEAVRIDASFSSVYALFSPFFFVGVGMQLDHTAFPAGAQWAGVLLVVAIVGKILGTALAAVPMLDWRSSWLLGVSMVPRAEIALVIMERGRDLGPWAVPADLFASMVLVCAATSVLAPLVLARELRSERARRRNASKWADR